MLNVDGNLLSLVSALNSYNNKADSFAVKKSAKNTSNLFEINKTSGNNNLDEFQLSSKNNDIGLF